jgi:hypothetical protein
MQMNKKHLLIMLACCLIPLAGLVAITVFRVPTSSVVYFGLILLCPALHLLMMRGMTHPPGPERSEGVGHDHGDQGGAGQHLVHSHDECHAGHPTEAVAKRHAAQAEIGAPQ